MPPQPPHSSGGSAGPRFHGKLPAVLGGRGLGGQLPVRPTLPSCVQVGLLLTNFAVLAVLEQET